MVKVIQVVLAVLILYIGWCVAQPYILKYKVTKAVDNIAQYATLHTEEESIREFDNRIKQDLGGKLDTTRTTKDGTRGGLYIEKDEDTKQVKARFVYFDEMKIFGQKVKNMEIVILKEAAKVDKMF
jgi:hypothetical protein